MPVSHSSQSAERPRKRAPREEVLALHAALEFVAPFNRQITTWQSAVARLIVAAEHAQSHETLDAAHLEEAVSLETTVRTNWERLAKELIDLPADIREHSRVADTRRAVESVLSGLERARGLFR